MDTVVRFVMAPGSIGGTRRQAWQGGRAGTSIMDISSDSVGVSLNFPHVNVTVAPMIRYLSASFALSPLCPALPSVEQARESRARTVCQAETALAFHL